MFTKNPLIRKVILSQDLIYHFFQTISKNDLKGNKILVNSFPKSGTHLLTQVIETLPNTRNYHRFITNSTSFKFIERSEKKLKNILNKTLPQEMITGHLKYTDNINKHLKDNNFISLYIYRDPRDIVISEAFYLSNMNRWHKMSKEFNQLNTLDEKILLAIEGSNYVDNYPNINSRFMPFKQWIEDEFTFSIKYEDLVSENKEKILQDLVQFINRKQEIKFDSNLLIINILKNINPEKSHTFREGGTGKWKKYFTEEHKKSFKKIAGELLIELGYEKDLHW